MKTLTKVNITVVLIAVTVASMVALNRVDLSSQSNSVNTAIVNLYK